MDKTCKNCEWLMRQLNIANRKIAKNHKQNKKIKQTINKAVDNIMYGLESRCNSYCETGIDSLKKLHHYQCYYVQLLYLTQRF